VSVSATETITLTVGMSTITMSDGTIALSSDAIEINGLATVNINGATIDLESEGEISLVASDVNILAPAVTVDAVPIA
jgi:hypothetical protein